jgi:putative SOS response-associated peptidase YedK
VLPPQAWDAWLQAPLPEAQTLLQPATALLRIHPVAPTVGNPRNQGPGLVEPLDETG